MAIAVDTRERLYKFLLFQVCCFTNISCISVLDCPDSSNWFWTSGQRRIVNNCSSSFVWKSYTMANQAFSYINFCPGEPSCSHGSTENCISFAKGCWSDRAVSGWQDDLCSNKVCPICEVLKFDKQ